jgi:hypothetical protein
MKIWNYRHSKPSFNIGPCMIYLQTLCDVLEHDIYIIINYVQPNLQAHCHYWVVKTYVDKVNSLKASPSVVKVLTQLCQLYSVHGILQNTEEFLQVVILNVTRMYIEPLKGIIIFYYMR